MTVTATAPAMIGWAAERRKASHFCDDETDRARDRTLTDLRLSLALALLSPALSRAQALLEARE